jgi:predicted transcriptional regulator of viral defense system
VVALGVHIQPSGRPVDGEIAELAGRQHGVVAHRQLVTLGLGREAIKYRVRSGRLHRLHRGVYAVGHRVLSANGRRIAAVLACGPGAVLSHRTAGDQWGIRRSASARLDVTAPRPRKGPRDIRVCAVRRLDPRDVTVKDGIPVTTVARTLLELAEVLRPRQLERALEEAERLRIFDLNAVEELCRRSHGRRGLRPLIALLGATFAVPPHTRSELERMFVDLCSDAGLPPPVVNAWIEDLEVDAHWPGTTLVVELDSWRFHRTRAAFERDRARDMKLDLADYAVLRLTHRQLTQDPGAVTQTLRARLGSARTLRAPGPGAPARG